MKRLLSIFLCVTMVATSVVPVSAESTFSDVEGFDECISQDIGTNGSDIKNEDALNSSNDDDWKNDNEEEQELELNTEDNQEDSFLQSDELQNTDDDSESREMNDELQPDREVGNNNHSEYNDEDDQEEELIDEDSENEDIFDENDEDDVIDEDFTVLNTSDNIIGFIPENHESLQDDMGLGDCLIADLNTFSFFGARHSSSSVVELEVPFDDGASIDVLHFVEHPEEIDDNMKVLDVSEYSHQTKDLLFNAISAYQDKYDTTQECVVIEIFENLSVEDSKISFEPASFSIFAVADLTVTTYEFYVDDALYNTQYLIAGADGKDTLITPGIPSKEKCEFLGWKEEVSGEYLSFGKVDVETSSDTTIKAYADFQNVYYVYFMYQAKEDASILETLYGAPGDVLETENIDYPISLNKHIVSWHTDVECTSPDVKTVTIGSDNITLYPKIKDGYWVTYYTEGGSYINPMFYAADEGVVAPSDPVKKGYSFNGWVTENNVPFEFNGQVLDKSLVLHATWTAETANYTIQILVQNPNNPDKYDSVVNGSLTKTGKVGSVVSGADLIGIESELDALIQTLPSSHVLRYRRDFFYYDKDKNDLEKAIIESDDSTVLYLCFNRYPIRSMFYLTYKAAYETDNDDTTNNEVWYYYDRLFGSYFPEDKWPKVDESEFANFSSWDTIPNNYSLTWMDINSMDTTDLFFNEEEQRYDFKMVAGASTAYLWNHYIYFQTINADGTVPDVGIAYKDLTRKPDANLLDPDNPANAGNQIIADNWKKFKVDSNDKLIDRVTGDEVDMTANGAWELMYVESLRHNAAAISYFMGQVPGFSLVAIAGDFRENIDGVKKSHPGPYIPVDYFDNYGSNNAGIIYDNNTKDFRPGTNPLPSGSWMTISEGFRLYNYRGNLYLRLLRNEYNLQFVDGSNIVNTFDVYYETDLGLDKFTAVQDSLTIPDGYRFAGWHTSSDCSPGTEFSLTGSTMPANDLILYAKWEPITVDLYVHVTIDGSDEIVSGINGFSVKYGERADKKVINQLKESVHLPKDAVWYGWYEKINIGGNKELLVPFNFDKQLIEDLTLYPFYSYVDPVYLFYDLNGGIGQAPVDNNKYATGYTGPVIQQLGKVTPPDGKVFLGWNTKPDGSGIRYLPNSIAAFNSSPMMLYAEWGAISPVMIPLKLVNTVTGEEIERNVEQNNIITVSNDSCFKKQSFKSRYKFIEWNTKPDGSGETWQIGEKIRVTNDAQDSSGVARSLPAGENALYAIYEYVGSSSSGGHKSPVKQEYPMEEDSKEDSPVDQGNDLIEKISKVFDTENHFAYIVGYPDGSVSPYKNVTRGEVSAIFYRLLRDDVREKYWSEVNGYKDVDSSMWCNSAISTLSNMGILSGYENQSFRPNAYMTRGEFVKTIVSFFENDLAGYNNRFTDVSVNEWYSDFIETASKYDIVHGYKDNTFRPNQCITRAEVSHIINKALGRTPSVENILQNAQDWPDCYPSHWYYKDIQEATNSHFYTKPEGSQHEQWTELMENRNWGEIEQSLRHSKS